MQTHNDREREQTCDDGWLDGKVRERERRCSVHRDTRSYRSKQRRLSSHTVFLSSSQFCILYTVYTYIITLLYSEREREEESVSE